MATRAKIDGEPIEILVSAVVKSSRSEGLGMIILLDFKPAMLNVFVGATQVKLLSANSREIEAKGICLCSLNVMSQ